MGVSHKVVVKVRDRLGAKGFTFFVDPKGGPEIYVAAKIFERSGFNRSDVKKDVEAIIDFESFVNGQRRAIVIHQLDGQGPCTSKEAHQAKRSTAATPGLQLKGRVKKFKPEAGYGFIRCEGVDFFFHLKDLPEGMDRETVYAGSRFEFQVIAGRDGKAAARLIKRV